MSVFPAFFCTSAREIPTLLYTSSLKKVPFRAEPPRIVHYREYPPPPSGGPTRSLNHDRLKFSDCFGFRLHRILPRGSASVYAHAYPFPCLLLTIISLKFVSTKLAPPCQTGIQSGVPEFRQKDQTFHETPSIFAIVVISTKPPTHSTPPTSQAFGS